METVSGRHASRYAICAEASAFGDSLIARCNRSFRGAECSRSRSDAVVTSGFDALEDNFRWPRVGQEPHCRRRALRIVLGVVVYLAEQREACYCPGELRVSRDYMQKEVIEQPTAIPDTFAALKHAHSLRIGEHPRNVQGCDWRTGA